MEILRNKNDFYTSPEKALGEIDESWNTYRGLVIVGSHSPSDVVRKLKKIKLARENKIPTLGICMGMQYMIVEYARNILEITKANSTEIDEDTDWPVVDGPYTMRVGIKPVEYNGQLTYESHWHRYKFNSQFTVDYRKDWDLTFGYNEQDVLEIMRLKKHPFFVGVQFHPEYQSSLEKPHWLLKEFITICKNQK